MTSNGNGKMADLYSWINKSNDRLPMPLISEEAAANLLDVSKKTMQMWRWTGKGPSYIKLGRTVRYKIEDIIEYINGGEYVQH